MDESIAIQRVDRRNQLKFIRIAEREINRDNIRNIPFDEKFEVNSLANKLKTKASITSKELKGLKNALLETDNIEKFLKVNGALRGLIRELLCHDAEKQSEAAACLCNLSIASARSATTVAKHSGSYLILSLENMNDDLVLNCLNAIGNIVSWGGSPCEIMKNLGTLFKLEKILSNHRTSEIFETVCYVLIQFLKATADDVDEHDECVIEAMSSKIISVILKSDVCTNDLYYLLFLLSCCQCNNFINIDQDLISILLNTLKTDEMLDCDNFLRAHESILRLLGNYSADKNNSEVLLQCMINESMSNVLQTIAKTLNLNETVLWVLGNVYNFADPSDAKEMFFQSLL